MICPCKSCLCSSRTSSRSVFKQASPASLIQRLGTTSVLALLVLGLGTISVLALRIQRFTVFLENRFLHIQRYHPCQGLRKKIGMSPGITSSVSVSSSSSCAVQMPIVIMSNIMDPVSATVCHVLRRIFKGLRSSLKTVFCFWKLIFSRMVYGML